MITLFSIPKPFKGHIGIIQRNAIASWSRLHPQCEIILFGDEAGTAEIAGEFNAVHVPNISRNAFGTPLLDFAFSKAQQLSTKSLMCFLNSDIILMEDFASAVNRIHFKKFLMVGERWNVDIADLWDFGPVDWQERLRGYVHGNGRKEGRWGLDYFVFPKVSALGRIKPFAVGRPGWDNWLIYWARRNRIPVVDATEAVLAVHQIHDYSHVKESRDGKYRNEEADINLELAGGYKHVFTLWDANYALTPSKLRRTKGPEYSQRRWDTLPLLYPATDIPVRCINKFKKLFNALILKRNFTHH